MALNPLSVSNTYIIQGFVGYRKYVIALRCRCDVVDMKEEPYPYKWVSNTELRHRKGQRLRVTAEATAEANLAFQQKVDVEFDDGTRHNVLRNHIRRAK